MHKYLNYIHDTINIINATNSNFLSISSPMHELPNYRLRAQNLICLTLDFHEFYFQFALNILIMVFFIIDFCTLIFLSRSIVQSSANHTWIICRTYMNICTRDFWHVCFYIISFKGNIIYRISSSTILLIAMISGNDYQIDTAESIKIYQNNIFIWPSVQINQIQNSLNGKEENDHIDSYLPNQNDTFIMLDYLLINIIQKNSKYLITIKNQNLFYLLYSPMGETHSKQEQLQNQLKIDPSSWKTFRDAGNQYVQDNSGRQGENNIIKLDPQRKIANELAIYNFRKNSTGPIVKCFGVQALDDSKASMCGSGSQIKVITQRIVKRWVQLPQLTFPQIIYALVQALQGYKLLHKQAGTFEINKYMLGINKEGSIKSWLNQNFAENHPSLQRGVLFSTQNAQSLHNYNQSQQNMIENVLKVIQQKCEQGRFPPDFRQFIQQMILQHPNFDSAIQSINNYIVAKKIFPIYKIHLDSKKMYTSPQKLQNVNPTRPTQRLVQMITPPFLSTPERTTFITPLVNNNISSTPRDGRVKATQSFLYQRRPSITHQVISPPVPVGFPLQQSFDSGFKLQQQPRVQLIQDPLPKTLVQPGITYNQTVTQIKSSGAPIKFNYQPSAVNFSNIGKVNNVGNQVKFNYNDPKGGFSQSQVIKQF